MAIRIQEKLIGRRGRCTRCDAEFRFRDIVFPVQTGLMTGEPAASSIPSSGQAPASPELTTPKSGPAQSPNYARDEAGGPQERSHQDAVRSSQRSACPASRRVTGGVFRAGPRGGHSTVSAPEAIQSGHNPIEAAQESCRLGHRTVRPRDTSAQTQLIPQRRRRLAFAPSAVAAASQALEAKKEFAGQMVGRRRRWSRRLAPALAGYKPVVAQPARTRDAALGAFE